MTLQQLKEEASKFPKATCILIPIESLNSLIDKAFKEGKMELIGKLKRKQPLEEGEFSFRDEYKREGYNECIEELNNLTK